jgi:type I restriction enzyme S subunit
MKLSFIKDIKKSGKPCKPYQRTIKYVDTGNLIEGKIQGYQEFSFDEKPSRANVMVEIGDVIFAKMQNSLKVIEITEKEKEFVYSTGFYSFKDKRILPGFLKHYFMSKQFNQLKDKLSNGTTMKAINDSGMEQISINVPPIHEQQSIVASIDKINELISANNRQIRLLDDLVKSKFIELQNGITTTDEIGKYIVEITKGPFGSDMKKSLYVPKEEGTYKVYIQVNVINDNQELGGYYITKAYFEKKCRRYEVLPGDVLITCDGTLGKIMILGETIEKGVISSSLLKIRLGDFIRPIYFKRLWEMDILGEALKKVSNSALKHLPSASKIQNIRARILPINKQIEFEELVKLIDKNKSPFFNQVLKFSELKNKFMNKYFVGDSNA